MGCTSAWGGAGPGKFHREEMSEPSIKEVDVCQLSGFDGRSV